MTYSIEAQARVDCAAINTKHKQQQASELNLYVGTVFIIIDFFVPTVTY